jgi:arylamine N-acetyltransferase
MTSLLADYARRLGLDTSDAELRKRAAGEPAEALALIDELLVAHTHAICFENLDVIAASVSGQLRGIPADIDAVSAKMLDAGRGGYCHEHAVLMRSVLTELGITADPVLARVHLGGGKAGPGAMTHQGTVVDLGGRRFLVDPGFGGGTPEAAVELGADAEPRTTEHGEHRLVPAESVLNSQMRAEAEWVLQSRTRSDQDFRTVYAFADVAREESDIDQANWYTATKPGTRFTGQPVVAKALAGGGRASLEGRQLRIHRPGDEPERIDRTLTDAADFAAALTEEFGLDLDRDFTDRIWSRAEQS